MKKLIAFAIAAIMVLSMIPAMAFTTSAAESGAPAPLDGFWSVWRDFDDYEATADFYKPAPGYRYTSEGFQLTSADYTNMTPKWTVQTSRPQDLTQGFYMEVRVDEFSYTGPNKDADAWISFNITDSPMVGLGGSVHNNNWCSLIRGNGDGNANFQSFITTKTTEEVKGNFAHQGDVTGTAPMDADGKEIYTLEVIYDGTNYDIKINGTSVQGASAITQALKSYENAYVGLTFHSGVKDGVASATILKQGTSAADATVPTGDDEAEAEDNILNFGPQIDVSTIEQNQPVLLWDAHKTSFKGDPNNAASSVVLTPTGKYTYTLKGTGAACYFLWGIKSELTVEATDAPIFVMLMKNYMGSDGSFRYCTGDIMSADNVHLLNWSQYDDNAKFYEVGDDEYSLVIVDMLATDPDTGANLYPDWAGRINNVRPEFSIDAADDEFSEWDIEYMAFFRTIEEANAYADTYMRENGWDPDAVEDTEPVTEDDGEESKDPAESTEDTGSDDKETTENGTTDGTNAGDNETEPTAGNGGCASVIGFGSVAILAAAAAVVALKKKD